MIEWKGIEGVPEEYLDGRPVLLAEWRRHPDGWFCFVGRWDSLGYGRWLCDADGEMAKPSVYAEFNEPPSP